ncbi:Dorsal-ventral patterning tolloid-like protein 1 [Homalodisca vitripennis]|nr:Dorsal-ventral patterning tolloid-like protein 1 [Homalodisca vitripennis]
MVVKSLISDPTALWPGKTVYYDFAPGEFSLAQRQTIISALNDIMFASCIRFIRRTTQPTYVVLRNNGIGCAAAVGYHGSGPLDLFLGGPTCQTRGTIQHELLHTLGFWHEHTRLDRDSHVTILWQNISPGWFFLKKCCSMLRQYISRGVAGRVVVDISKGLQIESGNMYDRFINIKSWYSEYPQSLECFSAALLRLKIGKGSNCSFLQYQNLIQISIRSTPDD